MKKSLRFAVLSMLAAAPMLSTAQTRYKDVIFDPSEITVESNVVYATNINFLTSNFAGANTVTDIGTLSALADAGAEYPEAYFNPTDPATSVKLQAITMDVYYPSSSADNVTERPLIIYIHTGNFLPTPLNGSTTGLKTDSAAVALCRGWAQRGYVAVSLDYRLGWNPIAETVQVRRGTLLNAVYRAIHDLKAGIRYLRNGALNEGNPYGIDESKIVVYGQGSGGYVAQAAATLDKASTELFLDKFLPDPFNPAVSYVDTLQVGTVAGFGFPNSLNLYRTSPISSEFHMAINAGGALADESWLEAGDVPMIAINCVRDDFAPFDEGTVIVPNTLEEVVDVDGANVFIKKAFDLGNNAAFANIPNGDPYTDRARSLYGQTFDVSNSGSITVNTAEGLFPLIRPLRPFLANESGPWEWWDPNSPISQTVVGQVGGNPITAHMASLNSNPDMSAAKGTAYLDTIQGYILPRIMCVFELEGSVCSPDNVNENTQEEGFSVYPNPANNRITIAASAAIRNVRVFDLTGKIVNSREGVNASTLNMDVNELPAGVYFVQINTEHNRMTQRIIVE